MIIPAGVMTGLAIGGSSAMGIGFELPDDSPTVQWMFKSRKRAAIVSTVVSLTVGAFCGPVAGVISEMINYPTCLYKVRRVRLHLEANQILPQTKLDEAKLLVSNETPDHILRMAFT